MCRVESTPELLCQIFDELQLEIPSVDTDLIESGALDSMTFVELLLRLERDFGVRITLDDLELSVFRTIATIAAFVDAQTVRSTDFDARFQV